MTHPTPEEATKACDLPDTLHELLELALSDLSKIEKNDNYNIEMCTWHHPTLDGKCNVCMAGAVLANTCKVPRDTRVTDWAPNRELWDKLDAIDCLRKGELLEAYVNLHGLKNYHEIDDHIANQLQKREKNYEITHYEQNKRTFKFQLRYLVKFLRNMGI